MQRRLLALTFLAACGTPSSPPVAHAPVVAAPPSAAAHPSRDRTELVIVGGEAAGFRAAQWLPGEQLVAVADRTLWFLDPKHPDVASTLPLPYSGFLTSDPHTDTFAVSVTSEPHVVHTTHLYRGGRYLRVVEAPPDAHDGTYAVAMAPDGKHVAVHVKTPTGPELRVVDVDTGVMQRVPGTQATFDGSGRYVSTQSALYTVSGERLVASPHAAADSRPLPWLGTTAFLFSGGGVDVLDAATHGARWISLPCRVPAHEDVVDAVHARLVRFCGNRLYVVAWPSGAIQRIKLPRLVADASFPQLEVDPERAAFTVVVDGSDARDHGFVVDPALGAATPVDLDDPERCTESARRRHSQLCAVSRAPKSPLVSLRAGGGLTVKNVGQGDLAHFGPPLTPPPSEQLKAKVTDGVLEGSFDGHTLYRFESRTEHESGVVTALGFANGRTHLRITARGAAREVDVAGACKLGTVAERAVMVVCRGDGEFEAVELRLSDLTEVARRPLRDSFTPIAIDAFDGGALATNVKGEVYAVPFGAGSCDAATCRSVSLTLQST